MRFWILVACAALLLAGCGRQAEQGETQTNVQTESASESTSPTGQEDIADGTLQEQNDQSDAWAAPHRIELSYAQEFTMDSYENGCRLVTISDGSLFLVVPEELAGLSDEELLRGAGLTEDAKASGTGQTADEPSAKSNTLTDKVNIIRRPVGNMYLAASAVMDMICELDGLGQIRLSGTDTEGWYIEEARAAMETGDILYAGKYSAPDYELILSEHCSLAIENTMITHAPEVKENLESFGIPVLVDYSSYENHPLGRVEWIKLYGVLLGKEAEADEIFETQKQILAAVEEDIAANQQEERPTVAFFYITNNGAASVRKSSDYVPKIIELAGGEYIYSDLGDEESHSSSMTMQIEEFYATAKDADYIIYNSTIDGEVDSMDELLAKCALLADFKAVQEGHVYCTRQNLYQESMAIGDLIRDIHKMIEGDEGMKYLYLVN
jgi:iron complex transport system substrate-binding protein